MIIFDRIFGGVLMDVISLFLEQRLEIFLEMLVLERTASFMQA